jgi:hypothetical protein
MSVAAHPGGANTNLFVAGNFSPMELAMRRGFGMVINSLLSTPAQGAVAILFAATAPGVTDGGYYGPQGFMEMRGGNAGLARVAGQAVDQEAAKRLWSECERLTGVSLF